MREFVGRFFGAVAAVWGACGLTGADAQVFAPYPDAIMCVLAGAGVGSGPRVFYIISQQPAGGNLIYRQPRDGTHYDFSFSYADGGYVSKSGVPAATTCDGQSLSQIQGAGAAFYLSGVAGSVPSGALVQFALSDCPAGWTRQTTTTSTVVLCQKD